LQALWTLPETHIKRFDLACFTPAQLAASEGGDGEDALLELWTRLAGMPDSADAISCVAEAYSS
jgi:hypothetical protein